MPSNGINIKNDNGEVQIDGNYKNLSLLDAGSYTMPYGTIPNGFILDFDELGIDRIDTPPVIAWKPSTLAYSAHNGLEYITQQQFPSNPGYKGAGFFVEQGYLISIDYAIFFEDPNKSSESYGLRVWTSDEKLCFDSGKEYLKIESVHNISISPPSGSVTINHPGISDPYYIYYSESISTVSTGGIRVEGLKKLSSTSVSVGWFLTTDQLSGNEEVNKDGKLLVCTYA